MKRLLTNLLVLAVSAGVMAGVAEGFLRLRVGPPVYWRYPQEFYQPDPEISHWMVSGQHAFTHDKPLATNAHGLRDADYPARKPVGTWRILAVGDSQTFGSGLALADTWPKQLEAELAGKDPSVGWTLINAGLTSTDTWQHERILARLAKLYEIDGVVLAFYTNDVAVRPEHVVPAQGITNTASKRAAYLLKRSALFTASLQAYRLIPSERARLGVDRERRLLEGEPDPLLERAWVDVEDALAGMKRSTRSLGIELLIAVLPRRDQVDGTTPGTAYNERVARIAAKLEIPTVDMLPALRQAFSEHGAALFIPWDGHDSALANQIIARELVDPVRALIARRADSTSGR